MCIAMQGTMLIQSNDKIEEINLKVDLSLIEHIDQREAKKEKKRGGIDKVSNGLVVLRICWTAASVGKFIKTSNRK